MDPAQARVSPLSLWSLPSFTSLASLPVYSSRVVPEKPLTLYTSPLTAPQAEKLKSILLRENWTFTPKPYTLFYAQKNKLTVAAYEKGPKVVIQGKGTGEFVTFTLEPEVLGEAKLGYEEVHNPERFEPHFGIDESGKGDFFGPLVIAGVYVGSAASPGTSWRSASRTAKTSSPTKKSAISPPPSAKHRAPSIT